MRTKARFWVGIGASVICLWLVTRQVSWPQLHFALQTAGWGMMLAGCMLLLLAWLLLAVRWRLLLAPATLPFWDVFSYLLIGYLGNTILPLRLGDVGRIALISRKHSLNVGFTSATVVLERLLDVIILVVMTGFLSFSTPVPEVVQRSAQAITITAFGAFLALILLSRSRDALARVESGLSARLPHRIVDPTFALLDKFFAGLQVIGNLDQMLRIGILSFLSWGIAGLSILCFARAFHLQVPWQAAFLVLTVTNLGSAVPSSPGFIGVYELLTTLALSPWISERSIALGYATGTHVANLTLTVVLGLAAAWREGVRFSPLSSGGWLVSDGKPENTPSKLSAPSPDDADSPFS